VGGDNMAKTNSEIKNTYAKKAYDDVRLQIKKGKKEELRKVALDKGYSLQGYIKKVLGDDSGLEL